MTSRQGARCSLARVSLRPVLHVSVHMSFESINCCRLHGLVTQFVPLINYSAAERVFPDIQACSCFHEFVLMSPCGIYVAVKEIFWVNLLVFVQDFEHL